jgi:hypothetical protein
VLTGQLFEFLIVDPDGYAVLPAKQKAEGNNRFIEVSEDFFSLLVKRKRTSGKGHGNERTYLRNSNKLLLVKQMCVLSQSNAPASVPDRFRQSTVSPMTRVCSNGKTRNSPTPSAQDLGSSRLNGWVGSKVLSCADLLVGMMRISAYGRPTGRTAIPTSRT